VVKALVVNASRWNHKFMEDQSMSWLVRDLGIPWDTNGKACSVNVVPDGVSVFPYGPGTVGGEGKTLADIPEDRFQHFIRVKQDLKRHLDIEIMKELHRLGI